MKCIQCNADNSLQDRIRNAGCCQNCGHPFVLGATSEPDPPQLDDDFFQQTIARVSMER